MGERGHHNGEEDNGGEESYTNAPGIDIKP